MQKKEEGGSKQRRHCISGVRRRLWHMCKIRYDEERCCLSKDAV